MNPHLKRSTEPSTPYLLGLINTIRSGFKAFPGPARRAGRCQVLSYTLDSSVEIVAVGANCMVPEERLELSWCRHRRILSPLRLPVPPFRPCVRVRASAFPGKNYNPPGMLVSEFDYALPEALIAQRPAARRTASRLLRLEAASGAI